ncbi:hypothetical protein SLS60_010156 [Paraconiothyrium brasiliense]|uniref:Uncharacterized protein n=1 Tax=Paraconiothyrium brasiliense TaxID=300254 RepID=A0ABR3QQG2_9PLEO
MVAPLEDPYGSLASLFYEVVHTTQTSPVEQPLNTTLPSKQLSTEPPSQPTTGEQMAVSHSQTDVVSYDENGRPAAAQAHPFNVPMSDAISEVVEAFAVTERRRNFHFLARASHHFMNGEDLSVYRADAESIEKVLCMWKVDPSRFAGSTWYTFFQPLSRGLTDTVPLRYKLNGQMIAFVSENAPSLVALASSTSQNSYKLGQCSGEATPVSVLNAGIDIQCENIEVFDVEDAQRWVALCAWMRNKYEWHDDRDWKQQGGRQLQHENQVLWWNKNGKHFKFLDLPRELRDLVYLESLGPIILPTIKRGGRSVTLGHGVTYGSKNRLGAKVDPDIDHPNTQLLLLNRQVHDEAVSTVWSASTLRFRSSTSLAIFSAHSQVRTPELPLRRVQLELSAADYFELIGIRPRRGAPFAAGAAGMSLSRLKQRLEDLVHLDLRFMSPNHPDARCPWAALARARGISEHSCQKTWIDWFLTFALKYFIGWKVRVTMSGCIKDSTRAKWEPILKQARDNEVNDMVDEEAAIRLGKHDYEPIDCFCTVPCHIENPPDERYYFSFSD